MHQVAADAEATHGIPVEGHVALAGAGVAPAVGVGRQRLGKKDAGFTAKVSSNAGTTLSRGSSRWAAEQSGPAWITQVSGPPRPGLALSRAAQPTAPSPFMTSALVGSGAAPTSASAQASPAMPALMTAIVMLGQSHARLVCRSTPDRRRSCIDPSPIVETVSLLLANGPHVPGTRTMRPAQFRLLLPSTGPPDAVPQRRAPVPNDMAPQRPLATTPFDRPCARASRETARPWLR